MIKKKSKTDPMTTNQNANKPYTNDTLCIVDTLYVVTIGFVCVGFVENWFVSIFFIVKEFGMYSNGLSYSVHFL